MAINPNIALSGQPMNIQQAIMGGLQTGEAIRNMGVRDALLRQQQTQGQQQIQSNQQAMAQNQRTAAMQQGALANQVFKNLSQLPMAQRSAALAQNAERLSQMGIDATKIDVTDQGIQQGLQATNMFAPQTAPNFQTLKPGETLFDVSGGQAREVASGGEVPDEGSADALKELRGELRSTVSGLRTQASTLKTNYNKLVNLGDEMSAGNRAAVSQGLIALVKLGDPTSVVREAEMEAALNRQNPLAAVTQLLSGSGTSRGVIDAVVQNIDPLSPENVDVNQIMATANAMMLPNIESLGQAFSIADQRGGSMLPPEQFRTVIGDPTRSLFRDLDQIGQTIQQQASERTTPQPTPQPEPQPQPQPANQVPQSVTSVIPPDMSVGNLLPDGRYEVLNSRGQIVGHVEP